MKKLAAVLLPAAVAPSASANICAGAAGRRFAAGGYTNVADAQHV